MGQDYIPTVSRDYELVRHEYMHCSNALLNGLVL